MLKRVIFSLAAPAMALVSPDGTGRLPAMGWNSWNEYACDINDTVFITVADKLVSTGLKDLGYVYVNIDDCWSDKVNQRDNVTQRIVPDAAKFPNGISNVADEIHARGLKLGIYGDSGTYTCGGYAGSLGYEDIDAAAWAEWGIDYLKYDNCNIPTIWKDNPSWTPVSGINGTVPPGYDWANSNTSVRYNQMRDALLKQDRVIQFSLCVWGYGNVETWGNKTGHSWRMYSDIYPAWNGTYSGSRGVTQILNQAAFHANVSNFWGHDDWDMLEVGNGNLTFEENRSHFALWAALKSPLIIGTNLETISDEVLSILSNKELIDFNQDPVYGEGVVPFNWDGVSNITHPANHWIGSSSKGLHVFLLNTLNEVTTMTAVFQDLPGLKDKKGKNHSYLVHDMWTGKDLGVFTNEITVEVAVHDTAALRITEVNGNHPNPHPYPSGLH